MTTSTINETAEHSATHKSKAYSGGQQALRSRRGYLWFMGAGMIIGGIFMLGFSAVGMVLPTPISFYSGEGLLTLQTEIATYYVIGQIYAGWILGPLNLVLGLLSLKGKPLAAAKWLHWANLLYVPLGTTLGVLGLLGLAGPARRKV